MQPGLFKALVSQKLTLYSVTQTVRITNQQNLLTLNFLGFFGYFHTETFFQHFDTQVLSVQIFNVRLQ
jgi:hypothetical protein